MSLTALRAVGPGGLSVPPSRRVNAGNVLRSLLHTLKETSLCSLATVNPDGRAHICHVYFAYSPTLQLYFLSDPNSRHCKNLESNPSMAVSVFDSNQRWGGRDIGVALHGSCHVTMGKAAQAAEREYGQRFDAYSKWRANVGPNDLSGGWRFYCFLAKRVKVFDETRLGAAVFAVASVRRRTLRA